jgi:putative FmdB family regulatory protein
MPIYEYKCPDCGHTFDAMQKMSDAPITVCPKCEAGHVKKLISATSFVLKGSGWYKDHYGLKSGAEGAKPAAEGAKPAGEGAAATPAAPAAAPAASTSTTPAPPAAPASTPTKPASS